MLKKFENIASASAASTLPNTTVALVTGCTCDLYTVLTVHSAFEVAAVAFGTFIERLLVTFFVHSTAPGYAMVRGNS